MSYILDALRRAEAERERGSVPGLHAQAGSTVAPSSATAVARASSSWVLPALAVSIVAVGVLAWRPWTVDAPPPAAVRLEAALPNAATAVVMPVVVAPALPTPQPPAVRVSPPPARAVMATADPVVPARRASTPSRTSAAESPLASASSIAPAIDARVYPVEELPDDVRQQVPRLVVGGSIYSASPASRFVIVNGQLFHEGDTVAPGVVLQQIRLKSAVLAFRGYRYGITF